MKKSYFKSFLIFSLYAIAYGIMVTYLKMNGYMNFEHLFISHNFILGQGENGEIIKKFFFSYPIISHILAYPFSFISNIDSPFYASILITSLLNTFIIKTISRKKFTFFTFIVFIYLLLSPIQIYAATSGSSFYLYYLTYFLLFFFLYNYTISFATYYLTLTSLIISLIPLLNHQLLWTMLLLIPILFFYSALSIQGLNTNIIARLIRIFSNVSLRRRFIGRFFSMNVIIVFFPITIYLVYLFINHLYGADYLFFTKNNTSSWNTMRVNDLVAMDDQHKLSLNADNNLNFISLILTVIVLFLVELLTDLNNKIKLSSFLIAPCLIVILLKNSNVEMLKLNYFSIFTCLGLASFVAFYGKNLKKRPIFKKVVYSLCLISSIYLEFQYFTQTIDIQEKVFYQSAVYNKKNVILDNYKSAIGYINKYISPNDVILCDNSVFFPIITLDNKKHYFIQNLSEDYVLALNAPHKFSDYIIISKENSPFYNQDNLAYNAKLKQVKINRDIVYESLYFRILKTH